MVGRVPAVIRRGITVRTENRTSILVVVRDSEVCEKVASSWESGPRRASHTAVVIFRVFGICDFYDLFVL